MYKVLILYICIGRYEIFWQGFYDSAEMFFLTNCKKDYFVFTDAKNIYKEDQKNVYKIYQDNLGWPGNTLFRYKIFLKCREKFLNYDYIFFLNANMEFQSNVEENILPKSGLLVVQHPGYYNADCNNFPYDRNPNSLAYICRDEGDVYICGGFNGGKREAFLRMAETIDVNTDKDFLQNIVARWHDESHINRYILDHPYKLLSPSYAYPEGADLPFECKVLIRDKNKYGGHAFLRGIKESKGKLIVKHVIRLFHKVLEVWA